MVRQIPPRGAGDGYSDATGDLARQVAEVTENGGACRLALQMAEQLEAGDAHGQTAMEVSEQQKGLRGLRTVASDGFNAICGEL